MVLGVLCLGLVLFAPAGTLRFWPGWAWSAAIFGPMPAVLVYLARYDPELLGRRMRMRERARGQQAVLAAAGVVFVAGLGVAGLQFRVAGLSVPVWLVVASNLAVFLGYLLFFAVLRANSYASRTLGVDPGQRVIDTGPYAWVRHPMYAAMTLMMVATPTALGSTWALPFLAVFPLMLLPRIRGEEALLRAELPGYAEYCERVRSRLIPGIW